MGDISKLKDIDLAHNSFELATELSPKNVIAWSRLGDIYMLEGALEKAMISYQNVIDIADTYLYAAELAHAKQQLALYYQKQEVFTKANQLQNESKKYYEDTGIYSDLTEKEILAYNAIYDGCSQNLRQYIYNLLNTYHF
jgi:tetratricopeptide (TPR) repeat protein